MGVPASGNVKNHNRGIGIRVVAPQHNVAAAHQVTLGTAQQHGLRLLSYGLPRKFRHFKNM